MDKKEELQGLTVARFFAAIMVVLFHFRGDLGKIPQALETFLSSGGTCVAFFFVLSGFVLVYAAGPAVDTKRFLVRRVARIWPVYVFAWAVFSLTVLDSLSSRVAPAGISFAMLQSWIPTMAFRWNMPGWSLSAEAFFYLSFPYLYRRLVVASDRTLWWVLAGTLLANVAHLYIVRIPAEYFGGTPFSSRWDWSIFASCFPLFRVPQFIAGMVLGLMFVRHKKVVPGLLPVSLAASLGLWLIPNELPIPRDIWLLPAYAALIYALAWTKANGAAGRLGLLLGRASYSIYILHWPLWGFWSRLLEPSPLRLVTYCIVVTAVSIATYQWIERPAERWIRRSFALNRELTPQPSLQRG